MPPIWFMCKKVNKWIFDNFGVKIFVIHTVNVGNFENEIFNVKIDQLSYRGLKKAQSHDFGHTWGKNHLVLHSLTVRRTPPYGKSWIRHRLGILYIGNMLTYIGKSICIDNMWKCSYTLGVHMLNNGEKAHIHCQCSAIYANVFSMYRIFNNV